jgi:hypothetical protein
MKFVALINATRGEPGRKRSSQLKRAGWLRERVLPPILNKPSDLLQL